MPQYLWFSWARDVENKRTHGYRLTITVREGDPADLILKWAKDWLLPMLVILRATSPVDFWIDFEFPEPDD